MTMAAHNFTKKDRHQYIIYMDTLEEKRRQFLDMQENPDKYSEDELQTMLDDPDMQADMECFGLLNNAAWSNADLHKDDTLKDESIAAEWQKFSGERKKAARPALGIRLLRVAAVFVGCLLVMGMAYAAVRIIVQRKPAQTAETTVTATAIAKDTVKNDTTVRDKAAELSDSIVKFNDTELEKVITTMAQHYGVKTEFKSEKAKHVHLFFIWNRRTSLADVLEVLNGYDRISVTLTDNTLTVK